MMQFGLKRIWLWCLSIAGIFMAGVVFYCSYLYAPSHGIRLLRQLDTSDGLFKVGGSSGGPISGWTYLLYWKRPKELWAAFYLEHDSGRWFDLRLSYSDAVLSIDGTDRSLFESRRIARKFKVVNGRLFDVTNEQLMDHEFMPISVYKGDPFADDLGGRAMDNSFPDWPNVWPKLRKNEKDIIWNTNLDGKQ